jgi:hypothetical protein
MVVLRGHDGWGRVGPAPEERGCSGLEAMTLESTESEWESEWVWERCWMIRTREPSIDLIDQLRLLSQLHRTDVYRTNLSRNPESQVPSACYGKGKCRKDIDSSTGL